METTTPDSRERLLEAMGQLLWDRGYAATSPRDVMRLAGVGQGSMYHHFTGKHDLALQALQRNINDSMADLDGLAGPGTPVQRLIARLTRPRPGLRGCRVGRMTQDPEVLADPQLLALVDEAFTTMGRAWAGVIQEAIDLGELPAGLDADALSCALMAVIQGGYVLAKARGQQERMDAAVRGMAALLEAASQAAQSPTPAYTKHEPEKHEPEKHDREKREQ